MGLLCEEQLLGRCAQKSKGGVEDCADVQADMTLLYLLEIEGAVDRVISTMSSVINYIQKF